MTVLKSKTNTEISQTRLTETKSALVANPFEI